MVVFCIDVNLFHKVVEMEEQKNTTVNRDHRRIIVSIVTYIYYKYDSDT